MPTKKKTEKASATEVKAEVVKEKVNETAATVETKKPVKKPVAKRTATPKKTKAKTAAKAVAAPKESIKIQFGGDEYDCDEIKKAVEADCKSKVKAKIKTIEIYIKPEDKAIYYVINSDYFDKINL